MSDMEETKPDANKLLTCKLEFEAHDDEDTPDLSGCVDNKPSIERTTGVKRSLILDSSDDEEFSEELLCSASGESESLPLKDSQNIEPTSVVNPNLLLDSSDDKKLVQFASGESESLLEDSRSVEQTSVVNPDLLLDSSDDEELSKELLCSASGSQPAKHNSKPLACYICKKEFRHNRDLLIHWHTHKNHSKTCNICGRSFPNMVLLNRHSAVHFNKDAKNSYVCKKCDCTFQQKQDFISHMLFFKHDENRIFKCNDCGGFFVNESDLKSHLATHQKSSHVFHCEECGENFQKLLDLRNHRVNHIGEKNYKCELCNLTFKSKFVMSKHQEVIHASKLVCSICNLSFSKKDKKNYDFHVKLHSK